MINLKQLKKYCCENISLIENYEEAVADITQTWHCHHRKEDEGYTKQELIEMSLYYKRPASELILLTSSVHCTLHKTGTKHSVESKQKMSNIRKGKTPWNKGKTDCYSEEVKKKMSKAHKGQVAWNKCLKGKQTAWNKGIPQSEEAKTKNSEAHKGKYVGDKNPSARKVYQINKNTGEIIKEWSYIKLAAKSFGLTHSAICRCCSGKSKTSGGFIWRYVDNKKEQD